MASHDTYRMDVSSQAQMFATLGLWIGTALGGLLLLGQYSPELFFILSFIGLLVTMQIFVPVEQRPIWWRYLNVIAFLGFAVFVYVLYLQIAAVL